MSGVLSCRLPVLELFHDGELYAARWDDGVLAAQYNWETVDFTIVGCVGVRVVVVGQQ